MDGAGDSQSESESSPDTVTYWRELLRRESFPVEQARQARDDKDLQLRQRALSTALTLQSLQQSEALVPNTTKAVNHKKPAKHSSISSVMGVSYQDLLPPGMATALLLVGRQPPGSEVAIAMRALASAVLRGEVSPEATSEEIAQWVVQKGGLPWLLTQPLHPLFADQ